MLFHISINYFHSWHTIIKNKLMHKSLFFMNVSQLQNKFMLMWNKNIFIPNVRICQTTWNQHISVWSQCSVVRTLVHVRSYNVVFDQQKIKLVAWWKFKRLHNGYVFHSSIFTTTPFSMISLEWFKKRYKSMKSHYCIFPHTNIDFYEIIKFLALNWLLSQLY